MVKITRHVPWSLVLSLKGFMPSMLKPNRTFLGSALNSLCLLSKHCHGVPSAGCAITSSTTLRPSSHHVMSVASLGLRRYVSSGQSLAGTTLLRQEFFSALHRCLIECPLGAEILIPPFLYPSYSSFSPWRLRLHRKGHCSCTGWPHIGDIYPMT